MKKGAKIKNLIKDPDIDHSIQLIVYGDGDDVHIGLYDPESSHILYVIEKDGGTSWMRDIDITIAGADVHGEIVCSCDTESTGSIVMEALQMGFDPSNRTCPRDEDGFYKICPATVHDILLRPAARMLGKAKKTISTGLYLDDATQECEEYVNAFTAYIMANYRMDVRHLHGKSYTPQSIDQFLANAILSQLNEDEREQINPMVLGCICYQWTFDYRFY